mmetsp:Transcript_99650/g.282015  ORF Transcript_99650/g.282015 Transcript_99650/m.282015 type:complete len:206 (-) Transcript_99650:303-920(-)
MPALLARSPARTTFAPWPSSTACPSSSTRTTVPRPCCRGWTGCWRPTSGTSSLMASRCFRATCWICLRSPWRRTSRSRRGTSSEWRRSTAASRWSWALLVARRMVLTTRMRTRRTSTPSQRRFGRSTSLCPRCPTVPSRSPPLSATCTASTRRGTSSCSQSSCTASRSTPRRRRESPTRCSLCSTAAAAPRRRTSRRRSRPAWSR